jgi:para-aminobenzoate synthetase component I
MVLLRSALFDLPHARYSFVATRPFLTFRSFGARCESRSAGGGLRVQFGDPWRLLDGLLARYELLEEADQPFPLGGCFGFWGYDLKNFVEPGLSRNAINDLELPDCHLGFYDSLVVFDHVLQKSWIISTGLSEDGSRDKTRARAQLDFWQKRLDCCKRDSDGAGCDESSAKSFAHCTHGALGERPLPRVHAQEAQVHGAAVCLRSNLSRADYIAAVEQAQRYIRAGDIYQVNLAHRLAAQSTQSGSELCQSLSAVSPAPFSAYLHCGDLEVVSSSPELFLCLSGSHIQTRPIKGTRPRAADPTRDAQLSYELQTSAKEVAELIMITDLLRNDLGRVCEYGSVQAPELLRLERYPQVQHLVSTVEGRLRTDMTHLTALANCFPGGSVTGAPKIRAMQIIDELEPVTRGPYTGCLGYLGFNRESQLSIIIRTAICKNGWISFHAGAGIVADSNPEAEYEETLAKAAGFISALGLRTAGAPDLDFRCR